MFKSGYIAVVGLPNVGKSTLVNALLGQKIAAVSSKPQTTRHRILGIKNFPEAQLLFLDTPGIHKPHKSLNEYMMEMAQTALKDADVFLFVIDAKAGAEKRILDGDRKIYEMIHERSKPVVIVINKIDKVDRRVALPLIDECLRSFEPAAVIPVSAARGDGLKNIEDEILKNLPEGPAYYPEDQVTDRSERFLVSEVIRQQVMELTRQEIPYSVTVVIDSFKEPEEDEKGPLTRIGASLIVEKDSHKGILIGRGGKMIKKIGELSRKEIEAQLGTRVFLELFVRVERDWSQDPRKVKEFLGEI